ncbi:YbaN family protein [Oceaniserpentilla sp. 4NH20-0058]|uniref:YbaN family protein n=1 Tax=Oceaniserpentilla sp. 4NH20-0058 TaxID=3127660 RepID=UPI00310BCC85
MQNPPQNRNGILAWILMSVGWLSVFLGVLGIFLPLLPTTPFLLLAAACFVRTSPKFYNWLIEHPKLGSYILHYLDGKGLPKRAKYLTIGLIFITMGTSALLVVPVIWGKLTLLAIGLAVSIYIWRLPTLDVVSEPKPLPDDS